MLGRTVLRCGKASLLFGLAFPSYNFPTHQICRTDFCFLAAFVRDKKISRDQTNHCSSLGVWAYGAIHQEEGQQMGEWASQGILVPPIPVLTVA